MKKISKEEKRHMLSIEDLAKRSGRALPKVEKIYKNTLFYQKDMFKEACQTFAESIKNPIFNILEKVILQKNEKNKRL